MPWQKWWGASQWAAYLEHMELPVKATTQQALKDLEAARGELLSAKELAGLMIEDALFALRLLKESNRRLPRHLKRDITTPLGVVLALGSDQFGRQLAAAPVTAVDNAGFTLCEGRAALAASIAVAWGGLHYDLDTGELALAALLSNAGEIELWSFAPELPQAALDVLKGGHAQRSEEAQHQACGFAFNELTLLLCEHWELPPLILQLIRGDENLRARLARLAVNAARHLGNGADDPALPHDVVLAAKLTGAGTATAAAVLPLLDAEQKAALAEAAARLAAEEQTTNTSS
jgi:HD-like signal output (HDOD) protein